jgi:flagellar hook-associated protein FlgK
MNSNREELASTRQHLRCLQSKTEKSLNLLSVQLKFWSQDFHDRSTKDELIQQFENFRAVLHEHFFEASSDALFESIASLHPSLTPQLNEIDRQHRETSAYLDQLIDDLHSPIESSAQADQFLAQINQLHHQIISIERLERHILELGWV